MADEQNLPYAPDALPEQIQYVVDTSAQTPPQSNLQYADPAYAGQPAYGYGTTLSTINPNTLSGKIQIFFRKPLGKIILFTVLFLGIAGMIIYSTNSVGIKGSFVASDTGTTQTAADQATTSTATQTPAATPYKVGDKVLGQWDSNPNQWSPATLTAINMDGTYNIHYDDGTDKTNRTKAQIADPSKHPTEVKVGQIVVYKHPFKEEWYTGLVLSDDTSGKIIYSVMIVGDTSTKDALTVPLNLNNISLTFEGVKEMDSAMFVGDLTKPIVSATPVGANQPPKDPVWTSPAGGAEIPLADLAKTEFKWTAGADDSTSTPNFRFAMVKGDVKNFAEMEKVFSGKADELNAKYGFVWITQWTEKEAISELLKLPGLEKCSAPYGTGGLQYVCTKFLIPQDVLSAMKPGEKYTTIVQQGDGEKSSSFVKTSFTIKKPDNVLPLAPVWAAPAANADLSLTDLAKTEFKWTAGVDSDKAPSATPNFRFAVIKGEVADQSEIAKIFSSPAASVGAKYGLAWIVQWTEKDELLNMQKLLGLTNCVADIGGGNVSYNCNKFIIPSEVLSAMEQGQKYTAITQQGDGKDGSPFASMIFSVQKPPDCPTDQYYIKDSKNSGCKRIPSYKGAFVQTGFICGLYKTILDNPTNSYRLGADTKITLQTGLDSQCSKKPDAVTNTCLTKMMYIPTGSTLCEPLKIITDPALSKDVCDQYVAEKDNPSLSVDTTKQIATIMGNQCKPKICPTGKFLNGISAPDNCEDVLSFPTKMSSYNVGKSCSTMKTIADAADALTVYRIDQATLDQIKIVAKGDDCTPKLPSANEKPVDASETTGTQDVTGTMCSKGYYLAGTSIPKDCKKLPDLISLTSINDINDACKLYKDLSSGKIDGKMDMGTTIQVKDSAANILCDQATPVTPETPVVTPEIPAETPISPADMSVDASPPSLSMQPKPVAIVEQLVTQPQQTQANVLGTLPAANDNEAPPSLSAPVPQPQAQPSAPAAAPRYYEALPASQATNYQPAHPVAGSYVPRSTAKTGPEMWIYSFGFAFATIGSRKWKNRKK